MLSFSLKDSNNNNKAIFRDVHSSKTLKVNLHGKLMQIKGLNLSGVPYSSVQLKHYFK